MGIDPSVRNGSEPDLNDTSQLNSARIISGEKGDVNDMSMMVNAYKDEGNEEGWDTVRSFLHDEPPKLRSS